MDQKVKKIRVAHIVPDSGNRDRQIHYEFLCHALKRNFDLHFFILKNNLNFRKFLEFHQIPWTLLDYNPTGKLDMIQTIWRLCGLLRNKFDIVHSHYFDGNLIGLSAAKLAGIERRVYTRHHNTYYHEIGDNRTIRFNRFFNSISHKIIAPCLSVSRTLQNLENVQPNKIEVLYHPFDIRFMERTSEASTGKIRMKYNIPTDKMIIGAVSSFHHIKGTEYILDGFLKAVDSGLDIMLVMANAHGDNENSIFEKIGRHHPDRVITIKYENDILSLYQCFDIFVHTPVSSTSEAFGQVYVEAMSMKLPCIFTPAGIMEEIGRDNENCLLVSFKNSDEIADAIGKLYREQHTRKKISEQAREHVCGKFDLQTFQHNLKDLYDSM